MSVFKIKILLFSLVMCLSLMISLFTRSISIIPGYKQNESHGTFQSISEEVTYVDCEGTPITDTSQSFKGNEKNILYPEIYSWLIGTNNTEYKSFGLRSQLGNKGFSIFNGLFKRKKKLNTDTNLMLYANSILDSITDDGSCIVLENASGEVRALVSNSPTQLDVNDIQSFAQQADANQDASFYWRGIETMYPPGSTFKIVSMIALLTYGVDLNYYDIGEYVCDGYPIHNYGDKFYEQTDLNRAIQFSLNTYFSQKVVENVGLENFREICEKFLLDETINLDFCTLESSLGLTGESLNLAFTGFGQGNLQVPDLLIAMWMMGIQNDGAIYAPRLLQSTKKKQLSTVCNKQQADIAKTALNVAAIQYGLPNYAIAKSGTSEVDENGNLHCYLVCGDGTYTYLISSVNNNTVINSSSLTYPMAQLMAYYNGY